MSEIDEWTAEMWEQADERALAHLDAVYQLDREATCKAIYTFYVTDQRVYRTNKAAPWSGTTYYNKMKTYLKNRLFQHERARVIEELKQFYPTASVTHYRLTTVFNRVYTARIDALMRKNSKDWAPMIYKERKHACDATAYTAINIKKRAYYHKIGEPVQWKQRAERYALLCMVEDGTYVPGVGYRGQHAMVIE